MSTPDADPVRQDKRVPPHTGPVERRVDLERDGTLLQLVRSRPGWAVDFEDTESVLFARIRVPQGARTAA